MTQSLQRRESQIPARREHIISTARNLIAELGIQAITMRDLAIRCDVAVGTLYNQFGSRDGVIAAALEVDFRGRFEPLSKKTIALPPAKKIHERIKLTARDASKLKDYTRAVMFFYFHHDTNDSLRSMIHDFIHEDFRDIVYQIKSSGDLAPWVRADQFADDLVTELCSISMKWSQGYIPGKELEARLMQSACASFIGISTGNTRQEFEQLAEKTLSNI